MVDEVVTEVLDVAVEDAVVVTKGDQAEVVQLNNSNNNKAQTINLNDNNVDVSLILKVVMGNRKPVISVAQFFILLEKMERTVQSRMRIFKTITKLMKLFSVKSYK